MGEGELRGAVEAWSADDPDEGDRAELQQLLDQASLAGGMAVRHGATEDAAAAEGDEDRAAQAVAEGRDRFADRLHFGTAGLRGVVAAGPNRMNRAVVRAATAAVAGWLLAPGEAAGISVVVGCDARHRSGEFADEVAGVLAGAGIAVHMLRRPCPTPLLAFVVRHVGTAAGILVTGSLRPDAGNSYKLY